MLGGEKLGHLTKKPVGTTDSFEVVAKIKTHNGIHTQTRDITREIVGHNEIAGGVSPVYKTALNPNNEEFVFYSNSKKLLITIPHPKDLDLSEVLYKSMKMARLYTGANKPEWISFSNLSQPTSMQKHGFQLITFKSNKKANKSQ